MAEPKAPEFLGTGRRKTSVARVRLAGGNGKIVVNGRAFENYFLTETLRGVVTHPLVATQTAGKYDVQVNVHGGGPSGQAGAGRHGIARALIEADATPRPTLKADVLVKRDLRVKERQEYGQTRARERIPY